MAHSLLELLQTSHSILVSYDAKKSSRQLTVFSDTEKSTDILPNNTPVFKEDEINQWMNGCLNSTDLYQKKLLPTELQPVEAIYFGKYSPEIKHQFFFSISSFSDPILDKTYKLIFDNAVMGIYKSTPGTGRHLIANPALAEIYGYENVVDLNENIRDISAQLFVDSERRYEFQCILSRDGICKNFESEVRKKNGEIIWISENARVVFDEKNEIQYIVGTVKDITERKYAEFAVRLAKEDWERTFNAIDDAVLVLDTDLKIRRYNLAAKREVLTNRIAENQLFCEHTKICEPDHCSGCPARLTLNNSKSTTKIIENKNTQNYYEIHASPIKESNVSVGLVYVIKNITRQRKLEREAEYRLQQAIQADKLKSLGEMVAAMAHEINNPNAFILFNQSLLQKSWSVLQEDIQYLLNEPEENRLEKIKAQVSDFNEFINNIKTGTERINAVVSELKDYSRTDSRLQRKDSNLEMVLEKALLIIRNTLKINRVVVEHKKMKNIPFLRINPQRIEQVFINLLSNAVNALKQNKNRQIKIISTYISSLDAASVKIIDNGSGLSNDEIQQVFDPFYTRSRSEGGTGLGLSISREILNNHHGKISFYSQIGQGSAVTITLPISDSQLHLKPGVVFYNARYAEISKIESALKNYYDLFFIDDFSEINDIMNSNSEIFSFVFCGNYIEKYVQQIEVLKKSCPYLLLIKLDVCQLSDQNTTAKHFKNAAIIPELQRILHEHRGIIL